MSGGPTPPFLFPKTESQLLPDPSKFFSPHLLSSPLPTHSFFQNLVVENGEGNAYIHPYFIHLSESALYLSYPRQVVDSTTISWESHDPLVIYTRRTNPTTKTTHTVSSFSDLSVTVDFPSDNIRFFFLRGTPFVTCDITSDMKLKIYTPRRILRFSSNTSTKYTIKLDNEETWLLYSSSPINLRCEGSTIKSSRFSGIVRIAMLPNSNPLYEKILDRFSSCYPISGNAEITKPFCIEYKWETVGEGGLLMLAHPLHLRLLSLSDSTVTVLEDFKYKSIDGELVGVVGDSWVLKSSDDPLSVTWHSLKGIDQESHREIRNALQKDVEVICGEEMLTSSIYSYGKLIARAARFAMIAEEVSYNSVIPLITRFLKNKIEPWLDGTYNGNAFLYDGKWGGIVMKEKSKHYFAYNKFGLYHDHHFYLGYFLYAIGVLAKIDPAWGSKYRPQAYSLVSDFMNLDRSGGAEKSSSSNYYPRLRCFDLWKLHSSSGGLNSLTTAQYLDNIGEALNAYYAATLIGLVYEDTDLVELGSTLSAMEINSAKTWCHVREEENSYAQEFTRYTRMVVFSSSTSRFGVRESNVGTKEYSLQAQVLPLLPITEVLFSDVGYVKQLVKWITEDVFATEEVGEEGKGLVCALEGIYDKQIALRKVKKLKWFADRNSLTNILWWIHSRGNHMPSPSISSSSASVTHSSELGDGIGNSRSLFTYEELDRATSGFSKDNWLGVGGFGHVYKGLLTSGKEVAIKQLNGCGPLEKPQFEAEVKIIRRIHHRHLVSFIGYCISNNQRFLVYEYMPNNTLYHHLHGQCRPVMAWANRVKVATGVARGIFYLHEDCCPQIIHRDIKSNNILLDHNFDAKVADFGLVKLVPEAKNHVSTVHLAGTHGYMSPEYLSNLTLTKKLDVYSFGVVLLELITGRMPLFTSESSGQQNLVAWAQQFLTQQPPNDEDFQNLVDPRLEKNFVQSEMHQMIKVAADCVRKHSERPDMSQVVIDLPAIKPNVVNEM